MKKVKPQNNGRMQELSPFSKKGEKGKTENFPPISILCSMSKVYERLLLHCFVKLNLLNSVKSYFFIKEGIFF